MPPRAETATRWKSYVWPKSLIGISELLDGMRGGLVGIVGLQGVGKTTSLMVLDATERRKGEQGQVVFKWKGAGALQIASGPKP